MVLTAATHGLRDASRPDQEQEGAELLAAGATDAVALANHRREVTQDGRSGVVGLDDPRHYDSDSSV